MTMKISGIKLCVSIKFLCHIVLFHICSHGVSAQEVMTDESACNVYKLFRDNLELNHSVYITDSVAYCSALSEIADTSKAAYSSELLLIKYADRELVCKYAKYYDIIWDKYPLLRIMTNDTIRPSVNYPIWANAMLGDSITVNNLVERFKASIVFSEKEYCIRILSRTFDERILKMLIEESKKNVYYYDRYSYACYNSKYFLIYWLRHLFFQEYLFCDLYEDCIQDANLYYISTDDIDDIPLIVNSNQHINDFVSQNVPISCQSQYIKQVESFVKNRFGCGIDSETDGLLWFYYIAEFEE